MYVIVEYKLTKDVGMGNRTFSPVRIIDTSETIDKFERLIINKKGFEINGSCDTSKLYNDHKKILIDLEKIEKKYGNMRVLRTFIRKEQLKILLD